MMLCKISLPVVVYINFSSENLICLFLFLKEAKILQNSKIKDAMFARIKHWGSQV